MITCYTVAILMTKTTKAPPHSPGRRPQGAPDQTNAEPPNTRREKIEQRGTYGTRDRMKEMEHDSSAAPLTRLQPPTQLGAFAATHPSFNSNPSNLLSSLARTSSTIRSTLSVPLPCLVFHLASNSS